MREREVNNLRTHRLAYLFLRTAALEDRIALLVKKYPKVPEEDIRKLVTLDPTGGKYLEWLVRNHGEISPFMDSMHGLKTIRTALVFYDKVKRSPVLLEYMDLPSDINRIHINELYLAWAKYKKHDLRSEREKIENAKKLGSKVIYDKNGYKIIKIEGNNEYTTLAACMYAKGTKWCTSEGGTASSYLARGPLYVVFKDGQKILQTDLKSWQNPESEDVNIIENDELSRMLVDSGVLSDPEVVLWNLVRKNYLSTPKWPAVEQVLAQHPEAAFEYARRTKEPFKLGEPAIASDPGMAAMYAMSILRGRFLEAEETIKTDPEWSESYNNFIDYLQRKEEQERGIFGNRVLRLAHRLMRIAGLEDRIQFYAKNRNISEEVLRRLAKADPTDGKYLGWLITNIVDLEGFSDDWLNRVRQALVFYQKVSKSKKLLEYVGLTADISRLNLDQVYNAWAEHKDEDLKTEAEKSKEIKSVAKLFYSDGPYKILQIGGEGTHEEVQALCAYSKGTAWCTRGYEDAEHYIAFGPLFMGFNGNQRLFLANSNGREINDVANKEIQLTDEILFMLLKSGLFKYWADQAYASANTLYKRKDKLFDYLIYHKDVHLNEHPEFLQYMMDHRLVSQERMTQYLEVLGIRLPNVEAYIATDPHASLRYSRYVLDEPWPEGEAAIFSVPELWQKYLKTFEGRLTSV
jgi:hypothetical protein